MGKSEPLLDYRELENVLQGRVDPHIYAFSTNTIPNYLKIGDTGRPVEIRIGEWKEKFPDLVLRFEARAMVSENVYYRDYSVHRYLEKIDKKRLSRDDINADKYYSNEFFKNTSIKDVKKAISDIVNKYGDSSSTIYDYYVIDKDLKKKKQRKALVRVGPYTLRDNQEKVVEAYKKAVEKGETNLLLYAVMRFGKSFTALCCDKDAKIIYIVSAKASDIKAEWENMIRGTKNFEEFEFITESELKKAGKKPLIKSILKKGKKVAVFLTLQDLQGGKIKDKHAEIFSTTADLLIVDETHFGAWSKNYGAVLQNRAELKRDAADNNIEEVSEAVKELKAKVTLHLSGTPYKILLGSKFSNDAIIGRIQFSDILEEKKKWDKKYFKKKEEGETNPNTNKPYQEWDNPYFGFPEMVRFAFNLNESSRKKLDELRAQGGTCSVSELFRVNSKKGQFLHEKEVIELFQAIDGSKEDSQIFSFLDNKKIKKTKMCQHMVFVLPWRNSCDALEALITKNKKLFKNINEYKVINIAGIKGWKRYKTPDEIKEEIASNERKGQKTITLTVNRMLTGSTVREWDTMVYLKSGSSPQEYDQATYRIQSQYVDEINSTNGNGVIKIDKKPQTILVDFEPNRMFEIQVDKMKVSIHDKKRSSEELKRLLRRELKYSKIFLVNKNKIQAVTENNVLDEINEYAKKRSIVEEVENIPTPQELYFNNFLRTTIEKQPTFTPNGNFKVSPNDKNAHEENIDIDKNDNGSDRDNNSDSSNLTNSKNKIYLEFMKKVRTYYVKLLFYAFLTNNRVTSLASIIKTINKKENQRIAKNIGIAKNEIIILQNTMPDTFILDGKIENINKVANDAGIDPVERIKIAADKFKRISGSEIITPWHICEEMVNNIDDATFRKLSKENGRILDIASKIGEFPVALYERMKKLGIKNKVIQNAIYSIPTSGLAYEFTRKTYRILGLNTDNIASTFCSEEIVAKNSKESMGLIVDNNKLKLHKGKEHMKFDVIIGNPPYQENGNNAKLYPSFYTAAIEMGENVVMIFPSAWQEPKTANNLSKLNKKEIKEDRQIVLIDNRHNAFSGVTGAEWTNIIVWRKNYNNGLNGKQKILTDGKNEQTKQLICSVKDIKKPEELTSMARIVTSSKRFISMDTITSQTKPYGLRTDVAKDPSKYGLAAMKDTQESKNDIKLFCGNGINKFLSPDYKLPKISAAKGKYKVFVPNTWGNFSKNYIGGAYADIILAKPNEICTETFIESGAFDDFPTAKKHAKYLMTRFCRALLYVNKYSILCSKAWGSVPVQNYSEVWWDNSIDEIDEKLFEKYNIPIDIKEFVYKNIQKRNTSNVINFNNAK